MKNLLEQIHDGHFAPKASVETKKAAGKVGRLMIMGLVFVFGAAFAYEAGTSLWIERNYERAVERVQDAQEDLKIARCSLGQHKLDRGKEVSDETIKICGFTDQKKNEVDPADQDITPVKPKAPLIEYQGAFYYEIPWQGNFTRLMPQEVVQQAIDVGAEYNVRPQDLLAICMKEGVLPTYGRPISPMVGCQDSAKRMIGERSYGAFQINFVYKRSLTIAEAQTFKKAAEWTAQEFIRNGYNPVDYPARLEAMTRHNGAGRYQYGHDAMYRSDMIADNVIQ